MSLDPFALAEEAVVKHGALQKPKELGRLGELVQKINPKVILEIGSDAGGTAWYWTALFPTADVICIDLPGGPFSSGTPFEGSEYVTLIEGDSHKHETYERLMHHLNGRSVDFIFIDGDHTAQGVTMDYMVYAYACYPKMLAFHDILVHPQHPEVEVYSLWSMITTTKMTVGFATVHEIVEEPLDWGGIGVLHYKDLHYERANLHA